MLKRLLSIVLSFALLLGVFAMPLEASEPKHIIKLEGTSLDLKNEIYTDEEGKIMIPLRQVLEELDYEVKWNSEDKSINISNKLQNLNFKIGELNSVLRLSKTYIPLELLSDSLNLIVGLDNKQQIIKIGQPKVSQENFFGMTEKDTIKTNLNDYMKALEKNQNFYGSVLVAKDGKVLINAGYGFADFKQGTKNKPGTKFAIGSITKQFTAMGIMQLVEKDLIKVEDKISKYIPNAPHGDKITIHNLLTHTSGLVNYTNTNEFISADIQNKDPMVMVNIIKDFPLAFEPGERFEYTNTNYLLLGMIIENVTEESFGDYLQANIFNPLNMNDTGISYIENSEIPDATPYVGHLEVQPIDDELTLTQSYGAGNIYSTVEDLYRWNQALKTEKLVKKETLDKIFKEHIPMTEESSYGYGWMIEDTELGKEIYHGGNTFGFSSNIVRYIDENLTVIILSNKGVFDVSKLTNTLIDISLDKEYKLPEKIEEKEIEDQKLYDKYVGKYDFISGTYMDIIKKGEDLYAQVTGQPSFKILPETDYKFFAKEVDISIEFIENENGEVNEFIFKQMGLEIIAKRAEEIEEIELDPAVYDQYVGEYELAPGAVVTIIKENNKIFAQITGQEKFEIFPKSESEFFYKIVDAKITFLKEEGKVTKLIFNQNGQDMPAAKIK